MVRPLLAALCLLAVATPALANDTALHPGSFGPEPVGGGLKGPESVIAMKAEHLTIRFGREATDVTVRFTFRNSLPKATARQLLGFPDIAAAQAESKRRDPGGDAPWYYPQSDVTGPMERLVTLVNGKPVPTKLQYGFVKEQAGAWRPATPKDGHLMAWHVVWVSFPSGKDVTVERRYRVKNGLNASGVTFFEYVTYTGGVWKGDIGQLTADVTLSDGLTVDDLIWKGRKLPKGLDSYPTGFHTRPDRSGWQVLSPTALRLTWRDFEPYLGSDRGGFVLSAPIKR
jgi:hypothetical protein